MNKLQHKDFGQLAYIKEGSGSAIVLLHGFPESSSLWRYVVPGLAKKFTVFAIDLPGAGESSLPADSNISMEQMAEAVKIILDTEGIEDAVIVGHSMGGYVGVAFADLFPGYVRGLSFVHSVASADDEDKIDTRKKSIALIQKPGGKEVFIREMIPNLFSGRFKAKYPETIREHIAIGLQLEETSMIAFYNAMINRPNRLKTLSGADFPVQLIAGEDDTLAKPETMLQQSTLANVNFVEVYPECGHMSMVEHPSRLTDDLLSFAGFCYPMP